MTQQNPGDISTLVKSMVRELVDLPEEVRVEEYRGTRAVVIEVSVAPSDRGKIIGRQGRTANAIRELLYCIGRHYQKNYIFNLIESADGERVVYPSVSQGSSGRARETSPLYGAMPACFS